MKTLLDVGAAGIGMNLSGLWSDLKSAFLSFTLFDAIDILLLAFLFFCVFKFFKGKKGGALLSGIAICLVLWFISTTLNLNGTSFIFSKIFEIGVIALIIIFQPEIRDVLERLGSGPLNGIMSFGDQKKKQQLYYTAVDNICAAVSDLSRTKTGALIVLSRTTSLDDIIQSGVSINADTNSFLLRNLFFNKAPLHDGAVVIDEARVVAAGCLLPLTRRQDIDSDLGTRHRAAVGMSEISDAIIIVVSEETGIISVASDFTLTRNYTTDSLRSFLLKAWVKDKSEGAAKTKSDTYSGKKLFGVRLSTYAAVLLSVLCAVIFWLYVKIVPHTLASQEMAFLSRWIL
ncbi:MAG: diadenylate cyclase CdaA [Clostridia bacterium]|nr:diadenylate cyclase CdaA [Clostridia bacterium]